MTNLLPQKAKRIVLYEYWTRVAVVWMFLLAVAAMIIALLMVPTHILIQSQYDALSVRFESAREKQEALKSYEAAITDANEIAAYIDERAEVQSFMSLVEEIEAIAGNEITITQYGFSQSLKKLEPMTVGGIAADRGALAAFRDALAARDEFKSVELPISSLAADRDVPFTIKLTIETD